MESTAAEYFGRRAAEYDSLIRRCVPRYHEMQQRLLGYLRSGPQRILELGAGTGNLSLALAERFPEAELVLLDASPDMLAVAEARLASQGRRTSSVVARFEELPAGLGSFDLITSCISLHHVEDKAQLYEAIHQRLAPGGLFAFADQLRGVDDRVHGINWEGWLEFCRAPENCTPEETQSLLDHADEHDHYTPLAEHFRLLWAADFEDLDCVWRNWIWGIVLAHKS